MYPGSLLRPPLHACSIVVPATNLGQEIQVQGLLYQHSMPGSSKKIQHRTAAAAAAWLPHPPAEHWAPMFCWVVRNLCLYSRSVIATVQPPVWCCRPVLGWPVCMVCIFAYNMLACVVNLPWHRMQANCSDVHEPVLAHNALFLVAAALGFQVGCKTRLPPMPSIYITIPTPPWRLRWREGPL